MQALIDVDGRATVLSIDGMGAFDLVSRGAMFEGLRTTAGGNDVLPFVKQSKPTLAKPTLAKVKVLVACEDFGFWELIVWVF